MPTHAKHHCPQIDRAEREKMCTLKYFWMEHFPIGKYNAILLFFHERTCKWLKYFAKISQRVGPPIYFGVLFRRFFFDEPQHLPFHILHFPQIFSVNCVQTKNNFRANEIRLVRFSWHFLCRLSVRCVCMSSQCYFCVFLISPRSKQPLQITLMYVIASRRFWSRRFCRAARRWVCLLVACVIIMIFFNNRSEQANAEPHTFG